MDNPFRPDDDLRADDGLAHETRDVLDASMADVLQSCDQDRLARHLGLAHADLAKKLVDHPAALNRLAQRLGDGCADLPLDEAVEMTRAVLGDARPDDAAPGDSNLGDEDVSS